MSKELSKNPETVKRRLRRLRAVMGKRIEQEYGHTIAWRPLPYTYSTWPEYLPILCLDGWCTNCLAEVTIDDSGGMTGLIFNQKCPIREKK